MEGLIGDPGTDGHVTWETECMALSYEPAVHCGNFVIGISRGEIWGASDDSHGVALIDFYDITPEDDEWQERFDRVYKDIPQQFVWSEAGMVERVAQIAEFMEHPNVENVMAATKELYFAILQVEADHDRRRG